MWDSNAPLQLLQSMPKKLTKENLEKLQLVIDADKYKNSLISGFDLCGMYAPFCRGCKKTSIFPCAIAYVNMMRSNGMDVEIDAKPVSPAQTEIVTPQPAVREVHEEPAEEVSAPVSVQPAEPEPVEQSTEEVHEPILDEPAEEQIEEELPLQPEPVAIEENPPKRKIRIAMARKKY